MQNRALVGRKGLGYPRGFSSDMGEELSVISQADHCTRISFLLCPRENLPSRFKFKEYCPLVFRNLRERFGIDDQDYQVQSRLSLPSKHLSLGYKNQTGRETVIQHSCGASF